MQKIKFLHKRKKEHSIYNIYHYYNIVFYNYIDYIILMLQNSLLYKS